MIASKFLSSGSFVFSAQVKNLLAGVALLTAFNTSLYADDPVSTGSVIYSTTSETEVGAFGDGSLDFEAGTAANSSGYALIGVGGTGTVTIDGANSAWEIQNGTFLGDGAAGSITVSNGGALTTLYGTYAVTLGYTDPGTVTVTGAGSTWTMTSNVFAGGLTLGRSGQATLNVLAGGVATTTLTNSLADVDLGELAGSSATVLVDGEGSQWNVTGTGGHIDTQLGTATITVSNGGAITANSLSLSQRSTLTVTGTAPNGTASTVNMGKLTISSEDAFGTGAAPVVMVTQGGILNSGVSTIGGGPSVTDTGSVTVDGAGSQWNEVGQLTVGASSGGGMITLTNGGLLNVSQTTSGTGDGTLLLGGEASSTNVGTPASVGILYIGTGGAAGVLNAAMVMGYGLPGSTPADSTIIFNHNSTSYYFTTTGTASGTGVAISGDTQIQTEAGTTILTALSNNTGATTLNGGVLSISTLADGGTASGLGSSSNAAANLVLNGGTLRYTGAATSTDRLFTLGANGGTLDASGTGAVDFTNTGAAAFSTTDTAETLTLTGSSTAINILSAAIGDNGTGATTLIKDGAATWQLDGDNTYTGGTTVNQGDLLLGGSLTGPVSVGSGATFGLNSGSSVNGNATVNSGGTLGGKGTINGNLTVNSGGTLYPGDPSIMTVNGNVTLKSGSTTAISIANTATRGGLNPVTAGTDYDQIALTDNGGTASNLTINSGSILQVNDIGSLQLNSVAYVPAGTNSSLNNYFVFSLQSGTTTGQFDFLSDGTNTIAISYLNGIGTATIDGVLFDISYTGDAASNSTTGGQDVVFSAYSAAASPEPSTWGLVLGGLALLIFHRQVRSRSSR